MSCRPLRHLARLMTVGAITAAALLMSWKPRLGALLAALLSLIGLLLDGFAYWRGSTQQWPKFLDTALALLWTLCAVLLSVTGQSYAWLRLYAGLAMLASLSLLSCISACLRVPWVWQVAVDHVDEDALSPVAPTARRQVFRQACSVVTLYWSLVFACMGLGVGVNSRCNTGLAADGQTLVHQSQWMNLVLGGLWPALFLVLGARSSECLGRYATKRLLSRYRPVESP
ncbi:unnamed protein product [Effrenium voratum]|nr:unnamed protein product [Effrenium voratum]